MIAIDGLKALSQLLPAIVFKLRERERERALRVWKALLAYHCASWAPSRAASVAAAAAAVPTLLACLQQNASQRLNPFSAAEPTGRVIFEQQTVIAVGFPD